MTISEQIDIAQEIKDAFDLVSPFIEKHTSLICPDCKKVCCADKHGRYDNDDLSFLKALKIDISTQEHGSNETDPCRYITDTGCKLQRWMRPFRCTSFFCDPLLKSLQNDNAKLYRAFIGYLRHLVELREKFIADSS